MEIKIQCGKMGKCEFKSNITVYGFTEYLQNRSSCEIICEFALKIRKV
jgi:hypothetical protein